MTRFLLALAVLLALAAGALAGWWLVGSRSPDGQVHPTAAPRGADAGPAELVPAGAEGGGRRESATPATALPTAGLAGQGEPGGGLGIDVVVLDPQGSPIPGALVHLLEPVERQASSDALGRARVAVPTTASRLDLRVEAEGYSHAHARQAIAPLVEVTLFPAGRASGRVVEQGTGLAIVGAEVRLADEHDDCDAIVARSGPDGSFQLEPVPVGRAFDLVASAEGFADGRTRLQLLDDGPTEGIELVLEPGAGVRLRVVDFLGGQPVAGARLEAPGVPPAADPGGVIDAGRLVPASAAWAMIRVEAPGYCRLTRRLQAAEWQEPAPVAVPLLPAASFEGAVLDDQGRPLAGAEVRLASQGGRIQRVQDARGVQGVEGWPREWALAPERWAAVVTDASGGFRTSGVLPFQEGLWLEVSAPGWSAQRLDPGRAPGPGQAGWIEVRLEPARTGTVRGRLTLDGEPTGGTLTWRGRTGTGNGIADAAGRFVLADVEAGDVELSAAPALEGARYGTLLEGQAIAVTVPTGSEVERDLALSLAMRTTRGHVRTQRGDGVAGVEVVATSAARQATFRARSAADGRLSLDLPALPQPWTLQVLGRWSGEPVQALAGEQDVLLVVRELGRLRVRLVDSADGKPLREFDVRGSAAGEGGSRLLGSTRRSTPDPQGWLEVEAPSGSLALVVSPYDPAYPPAQATVVSPPSDGPPRRVELASSRGRSLRLRLHEESDRPPRAHRVFLLDEDLAARLMLPEGGSEQERWQALERAAGDANALRGRRIWFDLERRSTLEGIPDGRHRLVDLDGGRFEPAAIVVPTPGDAWIEVRWEPAP